mgnify:FL=1
MTALVTQLKRDLAAVQAERDAVAQRLGAADRVIADLRRDLVALAGDMAEARKARGDAEALARRLDAALSKAQAETTAAIAAGKATRSAQADRLRRALDEANRRLAQYGGAAVEVP